jgi:hypothetical protein
MCEEIGPATRSVDKISSHKIEYILLALPASASSDSVGLFEAVWSLERILLLSRWCQEVALNSFKVSMELHQKQ